jgi:hypothetical protein
MSIGPTEKVAFYRCNKLVDRSNKCVGMLIGYVKKIRCALTTSRLFVITYYSQIPFVFNLPLYIMSQYEGKREECEECGGNTVCTTS